MYGKVQSECATPVMPSTRYKKPSNDSTTRCRLLSVLPARRVISTCTARVPDALLETLLLKKLREPAGIMYYIVECRVAVP